MRTRDRGRRVRDRPQWGVAQALSLDEVPESPRIANNPRLSAATRALAARGTNAAKALLTAHFRPTTPPPALLLAVQAVGGTSPLAHPSEGPASRGVFVRKGPAFARR